MSKETVAQDGESFNYLASGVHEVNIDLYHQDLLTPEPALSSSGIYTLLNETPAHFRARNPRLSPWPIKERATKEQDFGTIAHRLLLGRGIEIELIEGFSDFKKGAAQERRDAARSAGKIPVLAHVLEKAQTVVDEVERSLKKKFGTWPIGDSEQVMIWRRGPGPIWCRALVDHLADRVGIQVDLKTTARCLSNYELARKIVDDGADIQAAHYTNGFETLFPQWRGKSQFIFCFVEVEPPYSVRTVQLPRSWLSLVGQRIDYAAQLFSDCITSGDFPGWQEEATLEIPTWHEAQIAAALEAME